MLTVLLMFIGASPGSTGGGIRPTFSTLMLSVLSMLTGKRGSAVFKRKISLANAREATTLATLALGDYFNDYFYSDAH